MSKSSMNMDINVNNYTIQELLDILELDDEKYVSYDDVVNETKYFIEKFDNEENSTLTIFFQDIQNRLLPYFEDIDKQKIIKASEKQTLDWYQNETIKQPDQIQNDKITDRKQKIDVYENLHLPMKRQQLGVNNNFNVSVAQDTLNPNLKNVTSRFINLDSQFRQASSGNESSSTDYTLDLSEHLTNVLSLRLYSIQIPVTWYAIDLQYGNTCFWLILKNGDKSISVKISIEPGNYSSSDFVKRLNIGEDGSGNFNNGFTTTPPYIISSTYPISYNPNNGKIIMNFTGLTYTDPSGNLFPLVNTDTSNNPTQIVFFDIYRVLLCDNGYCNQLNVIDQTLGWLMGYRDPYIYIDSSGNANATSVLDLYGPKYLILAIDDYNQNHINNGLISITELSTNVKLPSYYNPGLNFNCSLNSITSNNLKENIDNGISGDLLMEKLNLSFKKIPQLDLPTNPRFLTQAQIYSINEIIKNNEKNTNYRTKAPTSTDTFALIPLKLGGSNINTGQMYIEFGGTLQDNKRNYFGPVNIERMRVKLMDDKGRILNLNGADWSVTIISENLYQY
jgi:hypothetical protein